MKTYQPNLFSPVIPVYLLNLAFKIMTLRSKRHKTKTTELNLCRSCQQIRILFFQQHMELRRSLTIKSKTNAFEAKTYGFSINSSRHEIQEDFQNFSATFSDSENVLLKICQMEHGFNISTSLFFFFLVIKDTIAQTKLLKKKKTLSNF